MGKEEVVVNPFMPQTVCWISLHLLTLSSDTFSQHSNRRAFVKHSTPLPTATPWLPVTLGINLKVPDVVSKLLRDNPAPPPHDQAPATLTCKTVENIQLSCVWRGLKHFLTSQVEIWIIPPHLCSKCFLPSPLLLLSHLYPRHTLIWNEGTRHSHTSQLLAFMYHLLKV